MTIVAVAVAGGLGALARYQVEAMIAPRQRGSFPLSTLVVNVVGSLALGALVGAAAGGVLSDTRLLWFGTGFVGAFTTFSTFTYETVRLLEDGAWRHAGLNLLLSGSLSVAAAALGYLGAV